MEFSSKLLEKAVNEMALLPGVGKRTALRLVLHLLRQPNHQTLDLAEALSKLRIEIKFCKNCHNISDFEVCEICENPRIEILIKTIVSSALNFIVAKIVKKCKCADGGYIYFNNSCLMKRVADVI